MAEYRIKDWKKQYENHRTRELMQMNWVPIPNKMDGIGYTELVEHPNGAAHFGAWIAIVEIASRQDPRGTLPTVRGSTSIALSRLSRFPVTLFEEVLPRLLSPEIGWIEEIAATSTEDTAQSRAEEAQSRADIAEGRAKTALYRTEGKGMEGNGTEGNAPREPVPTSEPKTVSELGIEGWDELVQEGIKAGMSLDPDPASDLCEKVWRYRDFQNRRNCIQGIIARRECGQYSADNPQFTHSLANYVEKNLWKQSLRPRNRGQPNGKKQTPKWLEDMAEGKEAANVGRID
jgi:hypothetical protein